jgi:DNA-directed RNA polymerase specialized sigma subunit
MEFDMVETALSAQSQFFSELQACTPAQGEEVQRFVDRARQGDMWARHKLVEFFLPIIGRVARRHISRCYHLELLDIIQAGVEELLLHLDRALRHPNPLGYLSVTIDKQLLWFIQRHDSMIETPTHALFHSIASLDAPVNDDAMIVLADILPAPAGGDTVSERDYAELYRALDQLSEDQRLVLARRYGLFCQAPISQAELAYEWFPDLSSRDARVKMGCIEISALRALKRALVAPEREKFYRPVDIKRLYGLGSQQLKRLVLRGCLTPCPVFADGRHACVYDRAEVDALFAARASQKEVC